jgi:hypothetical protein
MNRVATSTAWPPSPHLLAWCLFAVLVLVYNANGREMGTYDSQPTKFAARELALYGRLTLDRVVAKTPEYGNRAGFQRDRHGHYRSAYSVVPSILAAVPASLLHVTGLVDLRAPLAPNLVAKLTASVLTAAAATLAFVALAPIFGTSAAFWAAVGLGLGTNLWPLASGTLWQLETVSVGLALALLGWYRPLASLSIRRVMIGAAGVALATAARAQVAPMALVLLSGLVARVGWRRALPALVVVGTAASVLMGFQWYWFGDVLGATHALQEANLAAHGVTGTLSAKPWVGAAGLIVSPNRGLVIFSPVVLVAFVGAALLCRRPSSCGEGWWLAAALVQFVGYSCYSMWWGGHTYGPRYLVDTMIPLAPAAAAGIGWVTARPWRKVLAIVMLAYSIAVAALGAFVYPADEWNQDPDVDINHQRLWDWTDMQTVRCWRTGPSPQNFSLIDREAVRNLPRDGSRP